MQYAPIVVALPVDFNRNDFRSWPIHIGQAPMSRDPVRFRLRRRKPGVDKRKPTSEGKL
jgi:hypothetical protein